MNENIMPYEFGLWSFAVESEIESGVCFNMMEEV